jgi:hypothetical protein
MFFEEWIEVINDILLEESRQVKNLRGGKWIHMTIGSGTLLAFVQANP